MENRGNVVVVTGASSGIGNACATFLAKKGNKVYGTCRNPAAYSRKADEFFELLAFDLTDSASISKAAEKIFAAEGRVDALVCCAGSGMVGSIEDSSLEEATSMMDINYFGTLRTIKAFLPKMREAGKGRILIVGGLEGIVASPFQGLYSSSEFALKGLAQSLRLEVASLGIEVGFIALGSFRTSFGQNRGFAAGIAESSAYRASLESAVGVLARDEAGGAPPLQAVRAIYSSLIGRHVPALVTSGPMHRRVFVSLGKWLPKPIFEFLVRKYFRLDARGATNAHRT